MVRKLFLKVAVAGTLLVPAAAFADNNSASPADQLTLQPLYMQASSAPASAPATPPTPLMGLLAGTSVGKTLNDWSITIGGYTEASLVSDWTAPRTSLIPGRAFDVHNDRGVLDQTDFYIDRAVSADPKNFAWGGHAEILWGSDASFVHSHGLFDNNGPPPDGPQNQWDLPQAYLQFNVPVGNGLVVTAGKWYTILGYEGVNPTVNSLFSHSFIYGYAEDYTQTGMLGTYVINPKWTVGAGFSRGWDQSTSDSNGAIDFLGTAVYTASDTLTFKFNTTIGPERAHNDSDYRTLLDFIAIYKPANSPWSFAANSDIGIEKFKDYAWYYGIVGYATYTLNKYVSINGRGEFFRDEAGVRTGFGGGDVNAYEATLGVTYYPLANTSFGNNLAIRPEFRYDISNQRVFVNNHDQFTAGVEAYVTY